MSKWMMRLARLGLLCCVAACGRGQDEVQAAEARSVVNGSSREMLPDSQSPVAQSVAEIAARLADGVGVVTTTSELGSSPPVFVFEEYHTSRIGQLEIAVMLLRLREQFGIKSVGLEGAYQSPAPLDATWFHGVGGPQRQGQREDVAVRMLAEGEISSPEALALVFPDEVVYGTEIRELYDRESTHEGSPELGYLISMAQPRMSQAQIIRANELAEADKTREALDVIMSVEPWIRAQYDTFMAAEAEDAAPPSCEDMERRLRAIRAEAEERSVAVEDETREDADSAVVFYRTCQDRSTAMVARVVEHARTEGKPTAMVIGAAHTQGVVQLLRERGVPHAVLRPIALHPEQGSLTNEQFRRKGSGLWARTSPGSLGVLLNASGDGSWRKPPPIIETATAQGYASLLFSGMVIAEAARDGKRVPDDIWDELRELPGCVIDRTSFSTDGYDVIFKATVKRTDGSDGVVWSRVGTHGDVSQPTDLEAKLLQARADLYTDAGQGGMIPPRKPPARSDPAREEGPGDGRRGNVVIARTGLRSLAVFGANPESVRDVGRLSS